MKNLNSWALVLVIIGGINWLLVGLFNYNLVSTLFNPLSEAVTRLIYILVGIAAIWLVPTLSKKK